jgi:hypothetical protein
MITQTWLRLTYALLVALVPWSGLLRLYPWSAVATQDMANPWRPPTAPKAAGDGFILIRGGTFFSGDVVTRRGRLYVNDAADHSHDGAHSGARLSLVAGAQSDRRLLVAL